MHYVDLSVLRTLAAIAERDTFEKAADSVHRTQAAVSLQMRKLEEHLGVKLFQRSGRRNELTPTGQRVLQYAQRMLALHDELVLSAHHEHEDLVIRIGAAADVTDTILPTLLRRYSQIYGDAPVELYVGRSPFLIDALREGKVDLVISNRYLQELPHFVLRTSSVVWIGSSEYHLHSGDAVTLALADEPSIFRKIALDALERVGRPWIERYKANGIAGVRAAVRAGLGLTVRTAEMVDPDLRIFGAREGLPELGTLNYYLYRNPEGSSERVRKFFDHMAARKRDAMAGSTLQLSTRDSSGNR